MFEEALKNLEEISKAVGTPVDYTQGGGGNTSAKLDEERMAVKASGYQLKQITPKEGYVIVNYRKIREFYEQVDLRENRDYEKESAELVKASVMETKGLKKLRPSVEAGFHSVLRKYVIHTHPVYANILCCAQNGRELVREIFDSADFATAWIPYISPGFRLTTQIREAIRESMEKTDRFPQVIFMENHGLIATADHSRECLELHSKANDEIRDYFGIREEYPRPELIQTGDNTFASRTEYLTSYFKDHSLSPRLLDEVVLYPDQLVYLNGSVSVDGTDNKMNIHAKTGEILYKTNASEARTMEEALLAYVYIIDHIEKLGLSLKTMTGSDTDFITNWEGEHYRKSLVKDFAR